jgi:hypothetical protein
MNGLTTHAKRIVGLLAAIGASAAFAAPSALGEPAYSTSDRGGQPASIGSQPSDAQVSGIERQLFPATQSDTSILRDRSTDRGGVSAQPVAVANQLSDPQVSGIERQLFPAMQNDASVLRDRSNDRGGVSSQAQESIASAQTSDDGFGWAQAGIGAGGFLVLMLLLTTVTLRRGRHQPKSA